MSSFREEVLSTNSTSTTSFEPDRFVLYKRRWLILMVLSLLQLSNALIWVSYSPIADYSAKFYNTDADTVNYLSVVYALATLVFGFFSAFILDYMGLRAGIIAGAWLNFLGAGIKYLGAHKEFIHGDWLLVLVFMGQIFAALAQPYLMFASTKLAALWFPEQHRALANTIGSMANPLGIMIGSLVSPAVVNSPADKNFKLLLGIHLVPAAVAAFMSVIFVTRSRPPTPPSASAEEESIPFIVGVKKIFRIKSYLILMISMGAGVALFSCVTTFIEEMLCPMGYSDSFAGLCGALMIISGIVGAAITGVYCDKTKKFEEVAKAFFAFAVISACLFTICLRYPNLHALIAVSVCSFGFFGFGMYPVCLELGVEITYPVAEATSSAFIIMSGQLQMIVYVIIMQALTKNSTSPYTVCSSTTGSESLDFINANYFLEAVACVVATLFILGFKANYKRMRAEQQAAVQRILGYTSDVEPIMP